MTPGFRGMNARVGEAIEGYVTPVMFPSDISPCGTDPLPSATSSVVPATSAVPALGGGVRARPIMRGWKRCKTI